MHLDPAIVPLTAVIALVALVGIVLTRLRQPSLLAFLLVGVLVGPHALGLLELNAVERAGNIGVLFLLFFIGMGLPVAQLLARWRVLTVGTLLQVLVSLGLMFVVGRALEWPTQRIVLIGFVISLSSTAVVLSLLRRSGELHTEVGHITLGVLLVQDLAVMPMLVVVNFLGGGPSDWWAIGLQVLGVIGFIGIAAWSVSGKRPIPSLRRWLGDDHDLEVFAAVLLCFGFALASGLLGLSGALGAFVAGIVVGAGDDRGWIEQRLGAIHAILVGAFFVAVGAQINPRFLYDNLAVVAGITAATLVMNTVVNTLVLRAAGATWTEARRAGVLLAQIGEFSFVFAALGYSAGIIGAYAYSLTLAVIALTLAMTPLWIRLAPPSALDDDREPLADAHAEGRQAEGAAGAVHGPEQRREDSSA